MSEKERPLLGSYPVVWRSQVGAGRQISRDTAKAIMLDADVGGSKG